MGKRVLCILAVALLLISVFTACSSRSKSDSSVAPAKEMAASTQSAQLDFESQAVAEAVEAENSGDGSTAITSSGTGVESALNAILAERKIIRKANVTIEVENFDEAYSKLNSILLGIGFIQESSINTEKIYIDSEMKLIKRGVIVVRVDKDKFDKVLNSIKGLGITTHESIGVEDVTSKYFDVESRLRLLRYEQERLEEYLKKLDDPDKIFKTESRLTDIRHEIESLTVTLRKLDDLIDLSTITINMNEKYPDDGKKPPERKTYGERLLGNFLDSFKGVITFCGELLILIVQALPALILLGLFVLLALAIYKRAVKKGKKTFLDKSGDDDK
ncbi:MAG TPA: DUF4349 domain-containing protein [Clostridiaceae bacterium]|nr:DUF4349 domain-containing protein [Clostridiaceae bacterium]